MTTATSWIDRITAPLAPRWTLQRQRARIAAEQLARHYEAASVGRRTQGWRRSSGDANAAVASGHVRIREAARDLVRNNPYAESALSTLSDHVVGWGISARAKAGTASKASINVANYRWKAWAETTACDAEGRHDFAGLQKLIVRTMAESGEVLVRRRTRRLEDRLPIPIQLQVLEPDFLDPAKDGMTTPQGGRIIQGVEFDAIGRRVAYWMLREHPGANFFGAGGGASDRIPASDVLHIFRTLRPGQVRGVSMFAPVLLRMKDLDDYEDAALVKQKIAACLAVLTTDVDGTNPGLGVVQPSTSSGSPELDALEPGMIANVPPGRDVQIVNPPTVSEHAAYVETVLRSIAAGLGITYEDLTGDFSELPFSAARMSRLKAWARVEDIQWRTLIPQLCDPVWRWAMTTAVITGLEEAPAAEWTPQPMPLIDPESEGLALMRLVRIGALSWPEMVRERGYDPEQLLAEISEWTKKFKALGVILDSDPSTTSQQGQPRETGRGDEDLAAPAPTARPRPSTNRNGARR